MATLKITLAMAIEAIKAIFGRYGRYSHGSYKVVIMGTQLKSTKKLA